MRSKGPKARMVHSPGAFVDEVRNAFANKYAAALKSAQLPSSSSSKNGLNESVSGVRARKRLTPDVTLLLYRCFADSR